MGTFSPNEVELGTFTEGTRFQFYFSYFDDGGEPYPVTLSTTTPNSTIAISGNSVSGYALDFFANIFKYVNQYNYTKTTDSIKKIPTKDRPSIFEMVLDEEYKDYVLTASANGETKQYIIKIQNDYYYQRNLLFKNVNQEAYQRLIIEWLNNNEVNFWYADNKQIDWISGVWPWQ